METKCESCSKVFWLEDELEEKKKEISELENDNEALHQELRRLRAIIREMSENRGGET